MSTLRDPVEEVRERTDLVEIISRHVALRKSGRALVGLCPFHNERTPSFHVNPERQRWKCFGCGEGGDVFSFVCRIDSISFREALEQLARKTGVELPRTEQSARVYSEKERLLRANSAACDFFRSSLRKSSKALEYIDKRGLGEATIEKYRLGYAPDSWDEMVDHLVRLRIDTRDAVDAGLIIARERGSGFYDRFRDRLMFPILDASDRVIAFGGRTLGDDPAKYLNSPETPLFAKNRTLYGLSFARRAIASEDRVIVVEGYMDAIASQEAGFENTVATMGTALTEEHVNIIARFTKNVVLAFDADSAGMAAALRSSPVFERAGFAIRILTMPRGEDPDSLLRGGDSARFAALVENALPVADYRVSLALSRHDLSSDEGKSAALREAATVLSSLDSVVERERLIRHLAKYHPNFSTGTALAEDHIRSEVARARSRMARSAQGALGGNQPRQAEAPKPSLIEQSERLLLGAIIVHGADASKVFAELPPKEFTEEASRQLAEAASDLYAELGTVEQSKLSQAVAGTPAEDLLTDLLVMVDESEFNHPIDELVLTINNERKKQRHQRMRALGLRIQEGSIKRGDEEFEEYWRLAREIKSGGGHTNW